MRDLREDGEEVNVIQVIDAGHYQKSVTEGKETMLVCRADGETMPCSMILAARKTAKATRNNTQTTTGRTT